MCQYTVTSSLGVVKRPERCKGAPSALYFTPPSLKTSPPSTPPMSSSNLLITTIVGLITDNNDTAYREEVQHLAQWCSNNNLDLNTTKTKDKVLDFMKSRRTKHSALCIGGEEVERVECFKFQGVYSRSCI